MAVLTQFARTRRITMTREAFERLSEGPPFYDYVDGEAVEVNRPSVRHQVITSRLTNALDVHVSTSKAGIVAQEISLELPDGTNFGPDVTFISSGNSECRVRERGDVVGVPNLVVEVLSPSTESYDRHEKMPRYHRAGIKWIWLVGQDSLLVEEYRRADDGYTLMLPEMDPVFRPRLFPGLELNLAELVGEASPAD